jgi:hypothetical protein
MTPEPARSDRTISWTLDADGQRHFEMIEALGLAVADSAVGEE